MPNNATALLLVDFQRAFDAPGLGPRSNPRAEDNALALLAGAPVVHIQHSSTEAGSALAPNRPGHAFKAGFDPAPGELWLSKGVNSAFIGTGLEAELEHLGSRSLVVAGLTTDHCVSTTVRMAGNLGFEVVLAGDASATFQRRAADPTRIDADTVQRVHLASLDGEFCCVRSTAAIRDSMIGRAW
ncbi:cysteine hydrolase family protein [Salinisphaera sp. LB1]|uniref:cysteine hydrolase family protein n=1 Tax=Salinisphaera sp. LB1 TaxID=2183911 RepID=UPI000D705EBD|nr:cysteine hydrolase family protein [Salinisphaera sp. LB1]AWN15839.1 Isochorismatase [Salinisphaera sp. LB1]